MLDFFGPMFGSSNMCSSPGGICFFSFSCSLIFPVNIYSSIFFDSASPIPGISCSPLIPFVVYIFSAS